MDFAPQNTSVRKDVDYLRSKRHHEEKGCLPLFPNRYAAGAVNGIGVSEEGVGSLIQRYGCSRSLLSGNTLSRETSPETA
jgi:hypothetical protein